MASWMSASLVAVVLLPVLTGCQQAHEDEVAATAHAFYRAVAERDGGAACDRLAPRTKSELEQSARKPCAGALLSEHLPDGSRVVDLEVFGAEAQAER